MVTSLIHQERLWREILMCTAPLFVEAITSLNVWTKLAWVAYIPPTWAFNDFHVVLKQSHYMEPPYVEIWDVHGKERLMSEGTTSNTAHCIQYLKECVHLYCPFYQNISLCKVTYLLHWWRGVVPSHCSLQKW
jgi:hypothetical protein